MVYEAMIGLEVHAELNTKTKMYCSCENAFGGERNTRICPVCTGQPGVLPVLNKVAVEKAILVGRMMNCTIAKRTRQYRKHYRYPDLPKGYQISQLTVPLCSNGRFEYFSGGAVNIADIRQIHIEEDAGKLVHDGECTYVDYNRCGVPLIEIVTEPCFNSSVDAYAFLEAVRTMLLDIGVSDCRMEEGSLRVDVNVSTRRAGDKHLNHRVEMKNLATFSGARRAIDYEIMRQLKMIDRGEEILPLTMRWDDEKGVSIFMRDKESAADYRFIPEPDIPEIEIEFEETKLPESETQRRKRLMGCLHSVQAMEIAKNKDLCAYFDRVSRCGAKECAKFLIGCIAKLTNASNIPVWESHLTEDKFCAIITKLNEGKINGDGAKLLFEKLYFEDGEVDELIKSLELETCRDMSDYRFIANFVLVNNKKAVDDYKSGKKSVIGFLVGQCMRSSGKGMDANVFKEVLEEVLECL
ncbi:MAG: Asp-tRNA(Asn)/Glu-tRNA(Gln) amidotransferase subunit GatB [Clostridia bacterium]|nr:Asp-tRNA(Asn)/Glu-tRNA(Gln) amidotransferase subunit GatB [Clostridia bacterium]